MSDNGTKPAIQEVEDIHVSRNGGASIHENSARERKIALFRLLWDKRIFILRLGLAGLVLSTLVAFLIPKRYESTTQLMPPDQTNSTMAMISAALGGGKSGPASGSLGSSVGSIAGDLLGVKNSADLFIGILQSRTVEDDLINKFDLRKIYRDRYLKDAREDLESRTDITADRKSGIIKIQVTDGDPKRAAAMAGEYVQQLDNLVTHVNTSSAHRERVFLEERLDEVKQDLESAEKNFSQFASKNVALDIPTQGKAMIEASAALKGQLVVAETELQGMRQIYTDSNVRVRGIQARVNELQKQIQELGGKYNSVTNSVSPDDQELFPSIRKLPVLGVSYADLFRNAKVQEAIFETLTQEYELAKVQEAKETPSVKVIDPPDVAEKKSYPHRGWIILGGTFVFLLLGVGWILGTERWNRIDPNDPGKILTIEVATALKTHLPTSISHIGNGVGRAV